MATETIDRVRLSQQGALEPGEFYTSAVRYRGKAGVAGFLGPFGWVIAVLRRRRLNQLSLPTEGIMATTEGRLLVFESDRLRRVKPTTLVAAYRLGEDAHLVEVADPDAALGAGGQWTYVTLSLGGRPISVEAPAPEAEVLAFAMRDHELDGPIPAPVDELAAAVEVDGPDDASEADEASEPAEPAEADVADAVDQTAAPAEVDEAHEAGRAGEPVAAGEVVEIVEADEVAEPDETDGSIWVQEPTEADEADEVDEADEADEVEELDASDEVAEPDEASQVDEADEADERVDPDEVIEVIDEAG